jgi:hypothetical protein
MERIIAAARRESIAAHRRADRWRRMPVGHGDCLHRGYCAKGRAGGLCTGPSRRAAILGSTMPDENAAPAISLATLVRALPAGHPAAKTFLMAYAILRQTCPLGTPPSFTPDAAKLMVMGASMLRPEVLAAAIKTMAERRDDDLVSVAELENAINAAIAENTPPPE